MPPKPLMCSDANLSRSLTGRVMIVTGSTSGIGLAVARQLAKQGARVIKAARNLDLAERLAAEMADETGAEVTAMRLDLSSLASVRDFASAFASAFERLDVLINNAGVMNTPQGVTEDGFETQIGVNFLGPFLLTKLLLPLLKASAPSRIVHTSSAFHERGTLDLDDLNWQQREYSGMQAYHDSKLAIVMQARREGEALAGSEVTSVSLHPGWAQSGLARSTVPLWVQDYALYPVFRMMGMITPWQCAQTTLHCAIDDDVPSHPGAYFSQCSPLYRNKGDRPGGWPMRSSHPHVHDDEACAKLESIARELVGL